MYVDNLNAIAVEVEPTKLYASEVPQWVVIVGVFAEVDLKPGGHLPEETKCFELLGRILYLLRRGDAAVAKVQLLKSLVLEHHRMFLKLYPECGKPKVHYTLHVPDCIARFEINLSCFSPERLHKFTKHIAAFAYNKLTTCLHTRTLLDLENKLCLPDTTAAFALRPPALPVTREWLTLLQAAGAAPSDDARVRRQQASEVVYGRLPASFLKAPECAKQLRCPVGTLCPRDLLLWQSGDVLHAGIAIAFFKAQGGERFFAGVNLLRHEEGHKYSNTLGTRHLVEAERLLGAYPHVAFKGNIFVVGSTDLLC